MIKIDKNNVEAFYLDYLEGNLNSADAERLLLFINRNPEFSDLLEDDDILSVKLTPNTVSYGDTEDLKTLPCDESEICLANIDYWLIAKAEYTLSESELKAVDAFVAENNLNDSEAYITASFLKPNLSETYGSVAGLKKQGGTIIPLLLQVSAIAAIFVFAWLAVIPKSTVDRNYSERQTNGFHDSIPVYNSPTIINNLTNNSTGTPNKNSSIAGANTQSIHTTPTKEKKEKQPFNLLKQSFQTIESKNDIAFNNPPKPFFEDIDLEEMFADFESVIQSDNQFQDNDYTEVDYEKPKYSLQEQYKPVTKTLSNLTSLNMSVQKMPEAAEVKQTVIKIGGISFESKRYK